MSKALPMELELPETAAPSSEPEVLLNGTGMCRHQQDYFSPAFATTDSQIDPGSGLIGEPNT